MNSSKKNVLYYVPNIDQSNGGVRQYALNLLQTLTSLSEVDLTFYVYHNKADAAFLRIINANENCVLVRDEDIYTKALLKKNKRRHRWTSLFQFINGTSPYRFRQLLPLDQFVNTHQISMIHVPFQYLPETRTTVKMISTLHDVQELHFPSYFSAEERAYRANAYLNCARNSYKVVVSYDHVSKDVQRFFDVKPEQISVCLLNMNNLWFKKFEAQKELQAIENSYGMEYLFYPANLWPHKNHDRLLEAFHHVIQKTDHPIALVLTGDKDSNNGLALLRKAAQLNLSKYVHFAGVLTDSQMYTMYQNAKGVVVPTLYEAGSFPLMEALLMKIPVICSNVTSLPETIGDDRFTFDPLDISDMTDRMLQLINDQEFREKSIANAEIMGKRLVNTGAEKILTKLYQ